jgi:hypothetical protein
MIWLLNRAVVMQAHIRIPTEALVCLARRAMSIEASASLSRLVTPIDRGHHQHAGKQERFWQHPHLLHKILQMQREALTQAKPIS